MRAAVVAVGSELLDVDRLDTNSLTLTGVLQRYGVELCCKTVVGDEVERIAEELVRLARATDLVLVTGGLGPTTDDVTREAAARAFGRRLELSSEALAAIEARFGRHGVEMPRVNRKQAEILEGAAWIPNPRGTAPGQLLELREPSCALFLLPGVPNELEGMVDSHLQPWLRKRWDGAGISRCVLKVACVPESRVEERIMPAYEEFGRAAITVLARPAEIHVWGKASGSPAEREERLARMRRRLRELLGSEVFAEDEAETLESVVGSLLVQRRRTVGTAESCTGGLLAERLTRVPGSSDYFLGGVVTYSNQAKEELMAVPHELLLRHGAVSEEVARAMARGAQEAFRAHYGIGITGVAGPGGGTPQKPVGLVHIAVAGDDGEIVHRGARYPGDRQRVRVQSAQWALDLLRRRLLERGEPG